MWRADQTVGRSNRPNGALLLTRPHYTHYTVRDNGAVRSAYSINRTGRAGEYAGVLASVTWSTGTPQRGDLVGLTVFGTRRWHRRATGVAVRLGYNGVIHLKKDGTPVATRVFGPVYLEARHTGHARLAVVARGLL